jgi:hypothetical protein
MIKNLLPRVAGLGLLLAIVCSTGSTASAANVLVNPGFELGPAPSGGAGPGWITFGNVYTEVPNPCIVPFAGNQLCKMFGTFPGVSGMFQDFPTAPGQQWAISSHSRYCSDDPMLGSQAGGNNFVVQKLTFWIDGATEVPSAAVESTILDGSFAANTWFTNAATVGTAPAGCTFVRAFILYVQPQFDGGAAQIDDVSLENVTPVPADGTSWGRVKSLYRN